jgi:CBS domain-containing membrane protein
MVKVRDVMIRQPVTLHEDDSLDLADDIMMLGRIRHLPVVNDGVVVGVLSQRDLFRAAASSSLHLRRAAQQAWLGKIPTRAVMAAPAVTTSPDADMREVVAEMLRKKIGCVPVVGPDGQLVGLVSETDCLRILERILESGQMRQHIEELRMD